MLGRRRYTLAVWLMLFGLAVATVGLTAGAEAAPPCKGRNKASCDTSAPSTPTGLAVTAQSATGVTLAWTASTDNVGVAGYDLYVAGVKVGTTSSTSYGFSGLTCGTSYSFAVDAYDSAGNSSATASLTSSTSACSSPSGDTSPPSTPTGLAVTAQSATGVTLAWTASTDNVGVAGYDLYVAGVKVGTTSSTSYGFSGLTCGTSYTFAVDAYDGAGNASATASLTSPTSACSSPSTTGTSVPPTLPASTGTVWYVSSSGSDANPGTLSAPWGTIQHALNVVQPGQTVLVRGGTYTENLVFSRAGTPTAPITLEPYPGETVVLHAASGSDTFVLNGITYEDWYPVQISGSYFRLHGFVIENALGPSTADVYVQGGANHIELSGNEIRYSQYQGVFTDRTSSYIYLLANTIHDNGWNHISGGWQAHGVYLEGSYDLVANNLIYNDPYGFGLQIYPANHDSVVTDNTIAASAYSSIVVGGSAGVYNITIRDNILYDGDWGVAMDSTCPTGPVTIDHNVIYAYKATPIESGCSTVDTSGGNTIADPLFVNYGNRDLHLQSASPALNQAANAWSEQVDHDAVTRPQGLAPDIGAYERQVLSGTP